MADRALGVGLVGGDNDSERERERERENCLRMDIIRRASPFLLIYQSLSTGIQAWRVDVGPSASILGFGARRPSIALTSGQLNLIVFRLTFG